jgi:ankyrin repeat protein
VALAPPLSRRISDTLSKKTNPNYRRSCLLLEKGTELKTKDKDRTTSLSYAAISGNEAVVTLLLENGANINATDSNIEMPL